MHGMNRQPDAGQAAAGRDILETGSIAAGTFALQSAYICFPIFCGYFAVIAENLCLRFLSLFSLIKIRQIPHSEKHGSMSCFLFSNETGF